MTIYYYLKSVHFCGFVCKYVRPPPPRVRRSDMLHSIMMIHEDTSIC